MICCSISYSGMEHWLCNADLVWGECVKTQNNVPQHSRGIWNQKLLDNGAIGKDVSFQPIGVTEHKWLKILCLITVTQL